MTDKLFDALIETIDGLGAVVKAQQELIKKTLDQPKADVPIVHTIAVNFEEGSDWVDYGVYVSTPQVVRMKPFGLKIFVNGRTFIWDVAVGFRPQQEP